MSIKAFAAREARGRLEAFQYDPKPLGPFDIEVKISHCGICHSDIHLIDNDWMFSQYPLVPGHEIVGHITATGSAVKHLEVGRRVGIGWQCGSCFQCDACASGNENLCASNQATCAGNFGGFADAIRVDGRFAFVIPDKLESENAAPLLCGGITVYSPLRDYDVKPHMKVGVIGIGGLGHLALQFSRAWGCDVTAISSSPDKEKEAKGFGAHHFLPLRDKAALEAAGASLDFIISTAHVDLDWRLFMSMLKPKGKLCIVGAAPGPITVSAFDLIMGRRSVCGSLIGGRMAIREMLEFAARHSIKASTELKPMSDVNDAVNKTRQGQARYRMVLKN